MASNPRTPLNRERVLRAAMAYADEHGLDALTMRALGQALGVQAMSLYNHVRHKDDLLDGLVDTVIGEIEVPAVETHWKTAMRLRAQSAHEVFLRHPWAAGLVTSRAAPAPAMMRYLDATFGFLRRAGFPPEMVDHASNAIDSHIYGFTLQKLNFPFDWGAVRDVAGSYLPMMRQGGYTYVAELIEHVVESEYGGVNDFNFGLDLLLDGLERRLAELKK